MSLSSQWFVAQAISSIRHGIGSRLASEVARRGKLWGSTHRPAGDFPLQGFAVTVRSAPCLAIEDAVGCAAQVLAGQAWIITEGALQDTIADAGTTVPLELGVRFSLQKRKGMPVLTVTSGRSRLPAKLSGSPAAIAAFARRCFAAARTAPI